MYALNQENINCLNSFDCIYSQYLDGLAQFSFKLEWEPV